MVSFRSVDDAFTAHVITVVGIHAGRALLGPVFFHRCWPSFAAGRLGHGDAPEQAIPPPLPVLRNQHAAPMRQFNSRIRLAMLVAVGGETTNRNHGVVVVPHRMRVGPAGLWNRQADLMAPVSGYRGKAAARVELLEISEYFDGVLPGGLSTPCSGRYRIAAGFDGSGIAAVVKTGSPCADHEVACSDTEAVRIGVCPLVKGTQLHASTDLSRCGLNS